MERSRRLAPLAGIVASLLVIGALVVPYALERSAIVGLYYDSGAVNPLVTGLLAVVAVVVFAAGRQGRTDPGLAAGVTLTLGIFVVLATVAWALTVRVDVAGASLSSHRWVLVALTLTLPATAAWYARSLGLL